MKQQFDKYTEEDSLVWKTLFERQEKNLQDKACEEYLDALEDMKDVLNANKIPNFSELNHWFESKTGWEIYCVPGLIPVDQFFDLLSRKKFCSSTWLRTIDQLDYLEEPDMFHDTFGHIPLLSNPVFSNFAYEFGKLGKSLANDQNKVLMLQRLYWFTIEFGLIEQNGLKIYGAGIASSFGESISSLADGSQKHKFEMEEVLNRVFKTDEIQNTYFVIDSFESLFESILVLTQKWSYELVS
ncbi:MAG: phenylalanine 4-monooxygenase [Crocinitomicaceae bacterium]|nr:phenylalanine 4-monooxygenase [Crocinitomicaceae bacterium]